MKFDRFIRKAGVALGAASIAGLTLGTAFAQEVDFYADRDGWTAPLAQVATEKTGVTVNPQLVEPSDKYQAFIQTSIAGNNTPALFKWWNGKQLEDLAATGALADLTSAWDKAVASGEFSEEQAELVTVDGTPYGILLNVANWVSLYNTEAFEKAGIANPPATWEELMDAAEKLKAAGYVPFNAPASGGWMPFIWFSQIMISTDPDAFVGLSDGSVPYDGPEVQKAFEIWGDMYEKGYFSDPREEDADKNFADGSAAMYVIGDWATIGFENSGMEPGVDFKSFIVPPYSAEVPLSIIVEAAPVVVAKRAMEEVPGMADVVDALMSADASMALSADAGVFNGNLKGNAPNAIVEANQEMVASMKPRAIVRWWEAVPPQIQGDLVSQMGSFMFDPSPETAQNAMSTMQAINADYWANK